MKPSKIKHFNFNLFNIDIWFGEEWEIYIYIFNFGFNFEFFANRSLFSISAGKNYKTTMDILFVHVLTF